MLRDILDWLRLDGDVGEAPKRGERGDVGVAEGRSYRSGAEVSRCSLVAEDDRILLVRIGIGGGLGLGVSRR